MGKGMDAASLLHPSASHRGPSQVDWGWTPALAGMQLQILVHPGAMQPFLPKPSREEKYPLFGQSKV